MDSNFIDSPDENCKFLKKKRINTNERAKKGNSINNLNHINSKSNINLNINELENIYKNFFSLDLDDNHVRQKVFETLEPCSLIFLYNTLYFNTNFLYLCQKNSSKFPNLATEFFEKFFSQKLIKRSSNSLEKQHFIQQIESIKNDMQMLNFSASKNDNLPQICTRTRQKNTSNLGKENKGNLNDLLNSLYSIHSKLNSYNSNKLESLIEKSSSLFPWLNYENQESSLCLTKNSGNSIYNSNSLDIPNSSKPQKNSSNIQSSISFNPSFLFLDPEISKNSLYPSHFTTHEEPNIIKSQFNFQSHYPQPIHNTINDSLFSSIPLLSYLKLLVLSSRSAYNVKKNSRKSFDARSEVKRANEAEDWVCFVCADDEPLGGDLIVQCSKCGISVHQKCYGINTDDTKGWLCDLCKKFDEDTIYKTECLLCPIKGGAMKQVEIPIDCEFVKKVKKLKNGEEINMFNSNIIIPVFKGEEKIFEVKNDNEQENSNNRGKISSYSYSSNNNLESSSYNMSSSKDIKDQTYNENDSDEKSDDSENGENFESHNNNNTNIKDDIFPLKSDNPENLETRSHNSIGNNINNIQGGPNIIRIETGEESSSSEKITKEISNKTFEEIEKPWVHLSCALWNPQITFGNFKEKKEIKNVDSIPFNSFLPACSLCGIAGSGPSLRCRAPGCNFRCHAECGRMGGARLTLLSGAEFAVLCFDHSHALALRDMEDVDAYKGRTVRETGKMLKRLYKSCDRENSNNINNSINGGTLNFESFLTKQLKDNKSISKEKKKCNKENDGVRIKISLNESNEYTSKKGRKITIKSGTYKEISNFQEEKKSYKTRKKSKKNIL